MKITTKWLAEYVNCGWDWRKLVDRLTISGLEFEGVEHLAQRFEGVVVGHVVECERHPNADRLSVCKVDVGEGINTIVCGAPNVASGQKVAVALPGCILILCKVPQRPRRALRPDAIHQYSFMRYYKLVVLGPGYC
mgnify:CR=1 FL=1